MTGTGIDGLAAPDQPLTIIDVGVRGGFDETWTSLPHIRAYGFEADPEECARLTREHGSDQVSFVPLALGAAPGVAHLHVTVDPACSSLYPPDERLAERYPALRVMVPKSGQSIAIDTLDRWAERERVANVAYLQLDTQGSELDVLRGATNTLRTVCALRVEVEFSPLYGGQPLFADVDAFLRDHGFVLWRLANLSHYTLVGRNEEEPFPDGQIFGTAPHEGITIEFLGGCGRLFWADAYFVRRDLAEGTRPTDAGAAARAASIVSALGFHDLAAVCR